MFEIDFKLNDPFLLDSGETLEAIDLRCTIYGTLNEDKSNAVLVFHALTGSSRIADWWSGVLGAELGLDTSRFAFVCVNFLGSCYGSTDAKTIFKNKRSKNGKIPVVTAKDVARANFELVKYLGIKKFRAVVGGSVGGMLALQFASDFPNLTENCVAIGATPLSPMGLALNHLQRQALKFNDIRFARQIAMVSYKSSQMFNGRFARNPNRNGEDPSADFEHRFDIAGYLDYQGEIFEDRFDAESYKLITKLMDVFDLSDDQIEKISAKVFLIGISSDWLFPSNDVRSLTEKLVSNGVQAKFMELVSPDGHDAFLSDVDKMNEILRDIFKVENMEARQLKMTTMRS